MLLIWYKFRHIKHSNTILCKHFSIKSLCTFDTCWWYNKMAYKSLYFTLHWWIICFSNRHFILVHLVHVLKTYTMLIYQQIINMFVLPQFDGSHGSEYRNGQHVSMLAYFFFSLYFIINISHLIVCDCLTNFSPRVKSFAVIRFRASSASILSATYHFMKSLLRE